MFIGIIMKGNNEMRGYFIFIKDKEEDIFSEDIDIRERYFYWGYR